MLICIAGARNLAIPVALVIETMRPQPVDGIPGVPDYVAGVSLIRGEPVPVINLTLLLSGTSPAQPSADPVRRFVTIRAREAVVALAVSEVSGVEEIPAGTLDSLPPLLHGPDAGVLAGLGRLDSTLLLMLDQTRLIPDDAWAALEAMNEQVTSS